MDNIYKYLNDIDMDIEGINSIDAELDDITKKRIKKNLNNSVRISNGKGLISKGIVVVVSLLVTFLLIIPKPSLVTFASNIPALNTLFQKFGLGYGGDFQDYTQIIDKAKKDKGYEVKINEIVMDDFSFKLIYTIKCPEKVLTFIDQKGSSFPHTPGKTIKIKGKDFTAGSGGTHRIIDDYTVQVIEDYDIDNINIPKNFNMEINFKEINNIKGNWDFNFSVSKEKISKNIKTYYPNKQLEIQNSNGKKVSLTFEKISSSPISTAILVKSNNEFNYNKLIFKDEQGNIIEPSGSSLEANNGVFTALYKFDKVERTPSNILVQYNNSASMKSNIIELILK